MIKEDIYREIQINEENYRRIENEILELQDELDKAEKLYKSMQEESHNNMDIFSPRSNKSENREKLNRALDDLETIKKELIDKNEIISACKEKRAALNEVLNKSEVETDDFQTESCEEKTKKETKEETKTVQYEPESDKKKEVSDKQPCISEQSILEEQKNMEDYSDTIRYENVQTERSLAGNKILEMLKNHIDYSNTGYTELEEDDKTENHQNKMNMEIRSGEVIILESERKKEKDFLEQLYIKLERCLALLNGNRNLCKKEMQQAKKMIEDYVESISN